MRKLLLSIFAALVSVCASADHLVAPVLAPSYKTVKSYNYLEYGQNMTVYLSNGQIDSIRKDLAEGVLLFKYKNRIVTEAVSADGTPYMKLVSSQDTVYNYEMAFGGQKYISQLVVDKHGNEIETAVKNQSGTTLSHSKYFNQYWSNGKLKQVKCVSDVEHEYYIENFRQDGSLESAVSYVDSSFKTIKYSKKCNNKGLEVEELYYDGGNLVFKYVNTYKYDAKGNWVSQTSTALKPDNTKIDAPVIMIGGNRYPVSPRTTTRTIKY